MGRVGRPRRQGVERHPGGAIKRDQRRSGWVGKKRSGVYFIKGFSRNLVKVGYAKDIDQRLIDLQIASAERVFVAGVISVEVAGISLREAERTVHEILDSKGRHVRGEWFLLREEEIPEVIELFWDQYFAKMGISPEDRRRES